MKTKQDAQNEAATAEELIALEESVNEMEVSLARRRVQLAWAVMTLIIFILVQFLLVVGLCLPVFQEAKDRSEQFLGEGKEEGRRGERDQ